MDEMTLQAIKEIASYGGLGACTVYFMWKDMVTNKELTTALKEFTVAINLMIKSR